MAENTTGRFAGEVSIVLCGSAGMGIQTVERLLMRVLKLSGFHVFATKEYMSRIRGGMNSTEIRVASEPVRAVVDRIDILIPLEKGSVGHVADRVSAETVILGESKVLGEDFGSTAGTWIDVPLNRAAMEIGDRIYSNIVAVGAITGLLGIDGRALGDYVSRYFAGKDDAMVAANVSAANVGYLLGAEIVQSGRVAVEIEADRGRGDDILVNGSEAVAMGAIAGGCNFIASYPMSPSTGVLTFLAQHGRKFGIVVEQAEDEIAAINMGIGAWYAGARAMVTTSGGGFALMTEGMSLAGMLESPMVVHVAQRPGPATGLPTRTEQGDLDLVIHGGHGEYPLIVLAPGTLEEGFELSAKAFNLADRYQVPVIILTDQYYVDSYYNTTAFAAGNVKVEKHFVRTQAGYKRYELTADGVSKRGIAGYGDGLICVDSDEHDEAGHITEDLDLRVRMVDKRLSKGETMMTAAVEAELLGASDYKTLVVCWGSSYGAVREAVERLGIDDMAMLAVKQVHPLGGEVGDYLRRAKRTIMVEGNAAGQLCGQIRRQLGIDIDEQILKYNGLGFTVEELIERIAGLVN